MPSTYLDAATRYGTGQTGGYCTGDDNTNLSGRTGQATAWLVRTSTGSQFQPLDPGNVVVSNGNSSGGPCAHQFQAYDPNSGTYWFNLLDPTNVNGANGAPAYDADFAASFHRWYTVCHVTRPGATSSRSGRACRSSHGAAERSGRLDAGPSRRTGHRRPEPLLGPRGERGHQHGHAARATYANTRLPIYTNTTSSSTPNFYLARMVPGGGSTGRILQLEFYDIGDVGGTTKLTVKPPIDAGGSPISCSQWTFNGSAANAPPSGSSFNGCILSGITSANYPGGFNGVLVDVKVNVPGNYTCGNAPFAGVNDPNGVLVQDPDVVLEWRASERHHHLVGQHRW